MDSDVEMAGPPEKAPSASASSPSPSSQQHVSRAQSLLNDLSVYGSPTKSVSGDADDDDEADEDDTVPPNDDEETGDNDDEQEEEEEEEEGDNAEDEGDGDEQEGEPEGSPHPDEESDPSDTENSSDASEDDVDKDLTRERTVPPTAPEPAKAEEQPNGIQIPMLVDLKPAEQQQEQPQTEAAESAREKPSATAPTSPLTAPPTSPAKPKKPKSHHVPVVPPPPVLPPPMKTIRLQITLGGSDNYEIDVRRKAQDEGVEWGVVMVEKKYADDSSDGESEPEEKDKEDKDKNEGRGWGREHGGWGTHFTSLYAFSDASFIQKKPKKKKKKKSKAATEYYDVNDPFIDDSELATDQRTYIAQTKQTGFYVSSGEVALVRDKAPKKTATASTKSRKKSTPFPVASSSKPASAKKAAAKPASSAKLSGLGTKESPIPLEDEDDGNNAAGGSSNSKGKGKATNGDDDQTEVGKKRKRPSSAGDTARKRRPPTLVRVFDFTSPPSHSSCRKASPPELQESLNRLKVAIAAESWENKSKFPPNLKPLLNELALQAIRLEEYDDQFFNFMPLIFPYNRFTMTKLIKRTVFKDHTEMLNGQQQELLTQLEKLATDGFPKAQEEWEKSVASYEEKKERAAQVKADSENPDGSPHGTDEHGDAENPGKGPQGPPQKKYRMSDEMKAIVWQLVLLSNETCRLENEKNTLEGSVIQVSEQGQRKSLYQKIVSAFPLGWMTSGQISRDVSAMKKKLEKETADE
ncbi:hypothetical protein HMN09_00335900 [Mycena chlorophos]|uniref:Ubinuclein middle domain-containing protein n=1 Tax=Mycena chlorophos TaxID=658473 RepID=A0A8H6TJF3_MYCCL|nr:hypothetical protein HMN09_00335900 [Mycena chlorophos]